MKRHRLTQEEKVANYLVTVVKDLTLDLDEVGRYIAINSPTVLANRLDVILESAREESEAQYVRDSHNPLF
jgi:hypothetical protein